MYNFVFIFLFLFSGATFAADGDQNFDQVLSDSLSAPEFEEKETPAKEEEVIPGDLEDLAGLANLVPFDDVAVIQLRYFPKTERFEFFGGIGGILNDAFFSSTLLNPRFGYYFSEQWGIEANIGIYSTGKKDITNSLVDEKQVSTTAFIAPKSYYGVDLKWIPIYGKFSVLNESIVNFDLYFSLGGGVSSTSQDTNPVTAHLGVGQFFALTRSLSARWDMSWYLYNSETKVSGTTETSSFLNMTGVIGLAYFFPEPEYR